MYFLWRNTPYGIIRVSCGGLHEFADDVFKSKLKLYSVTLSPAGKKDHADLTIVISEEDLSQETKKQAEDHIISILKPMGIKASIVWADPERGIFPILRSPFTWGVIASCSAVIITAGLDGFFWTVFWGAAAWFGVFGLGKIAKNLRRSMHG
ncbi:MAG: hypothetical protein IJU48_11005 [Synergistaceae bacterium]|nr:hypothetical protein [Synergistaceae bacterium]